jgi:phosphatidylinositol alpha-1,6-mannosyltransferase
MGWTNKFVILTVGRLQKRKGQDKMIEAMPAILEKHPHVHYAIVGSGECKNELENLIRKLGLKNNVQLLSEIDDADMIACYQQCDLFILPNRTIDNDIEGFGMVLVEAQACGKPVIAGDSGGTRETMLVGETGWVIDCSLSHNIVVKITALLRNKKGFLNAGERGRRHVLGSLDWQSHAKKAEVIFRS